MAGKSKEVDVDGRTLSITNLDKVLYPEPGFTKGEVIDYYARIAPVMLPTYGRPLTLMRYPERGRRQPFFEKRCPTHRPEWVRDRAVGDRDGDDRLLPCEDLPTLVWLAQLAALELHPSLSRAKDMETRRCSPSTSTRARRRHRRLLPGRAALRELFGRFDLECFPKTSGSKGMQVYVPLNTRPATSGRSLRQAVAQAAREQSARPGRLADGEGPAEGQGLRRLEPEHRPKTTVAVYWLRARPHPTASTPLELGRGRGDG